MPAAPSDVTTQMDAKGYLVFKDFETMDTQAERWGMNPKRLAWLENLQIINPNKLQTVPGPAPAAVTIPGVTLYRQYYAFFNSGDFIIAFGNDGSGWQFNLAGTAATQFAPAGTFSDPDVSAWNQQRILIADPTAGYSTWDGTIFVKSGGLSPNITVTNGGTGYLAPPTVTITGGSGSGATAVAKIFAGSVVSVQLTNPGVNYKVGDVLTVTFAGTGTGAAATARTFPISTAPANTLAVAFGRVWLGGNNLLQWTGTQGFDDFNPANAAGFTQITDTDLVHRITALRFMNNFLYIFGDNSIKQIGTISVSGAVTVFQITTLSSDTGTIFPRSVASYNRVATFCNFEGIWQIYGATVSKISNEMDGIFGNPAVGAPLIDFSLQPQAFVATINGQRCYVLMVRYLDPVVGARTLFLTRQTTRWFTISQGNAIISCTTVVLNGQVQPYASSGNDLTNILSAPAVPVNVTLKTALDAQNKEMLSKRHLRIALTNLITVPGTINFTGDTENGSVAGSFTNSFPVIWVNSSAGVVTWQNASLQTVTFVGPGFAWNESQDGGTGIYLGMSLTGLLAGFHFNNVVIEYEDGARMRNRNK